MQAQLTTQFIPTHVSKVWEYDRNRRRLWVLGQRCHHGATGSFLAVIGCALMAHDWKDRPIWFERGHGTQP